MQNRNIVDEIFKELSKVEFDNPKNDMILFPSLSGSKVKKLLNILENIEASDAEKQFTEEEQLALATVLEGYSQTTRGKELENVANLREWLVSIVDEETGKEIGIRTVPISKGEDGRVSGNKAALMFSNYLGLGGAIQIPLWHSGFWIILNKIEDVDLIALEMKLGTRFKELGRMTNGAVFSNDDVLYNETLIDFAISHIDSISVDLSESDVQLKDLIMMPDLPHIVLGIVKSIAPTGMNVLMGCGVVGETTETKKGCDFTFNSRIDPAKLTWTNRDKLSREQIKHMTHRAPNSVTLEAVKKYQSELSCLKPAKLNIEASNGAEIIITAKMPTINQHIEQGNMWIEDTINSVNELIGNETITDDNRRSKIIELSRTTRLNTYIHFIKNIIFGDQYVESQEDIAQVLNIITGDDKVYNDIIADIKTYINMSVISVVGIPVYICPKCKKESNSLGGEFEEITPLEINNIFFDLSTRRKQKIMERIEDIS